MNNMGKNWFVCLVLFVAASAIGAILFAYDSRELSSGYVPKGEIKNVDNSKGKGSYMLSYGPFHNLRDEVYLVTLKYKTNTNNNSYSIYSDTTSILYMADLDKDATQVTNWINNPNVKLQVLTFYSGKGELQIDSVKVIPLKLLVFWVASLISIILALFVRGKAGSVLKKLMQCIICVLVLCMAFYVDDSAATANNGILLVILAGATIISMLFLVWEKIGYREEIFILNFSACWIVEWKNIMNYNLDYMTLFLSGAIACCIFSICYMFIANIKKYYIITTCITSLFIIYSTIQYVYYTYFKDFFTIKIIRLLFTAMEASSSIEELIDGTALSYIGLSVGYIILVILVAIQWRVLQQRKVRRMHIGNGMQ